MQLNKVPTNTKLLDNNRSVLKYLSPITDPSFYEGTSRIFSSKGLFSTEIFGSVMEPKRQRNFGYIDLNTKIMHPILYKNIEKVAAYYTDIITGKGYAVWDEVNKVFVKSNEIEGETGYAFFLKYFKDLKFERNDSDRRNTRIDVLDKYRDTAIYDFIMVMPAGLREVEEGNDGNLKADEVNDFYRSIIGLASNIDTLDPDNPFNDNTKVLIQRNFNAIYDLVFSYLKGKTGLIQGKFFKRKLEYGTRSVLTASEVSVDDMYGPQAQGIDDCAVGLYQSLKGTIPLVVYHTKTHRLIAGNLNSDLSAQTINPKTLMVETIDIKAKEYESFTTESGINSMVNRMTKRRYRRRPVTLGGNYLAMVLLDEAAGTFKIVTDPQTMNEADRKKLTPITYLELMYYICGPHIHGRPVWVTRYPTTGEESCTPNLVYLKTTMEGLALKELDENDQVINAPDGGYVYREWPTKSKEYLETIAVHPNKLAGKRGDHDGDLGSADYALGEESLAETLAYLDDIKSAMRGGKLKDLLSTDLAEWTLAFMTNPA